MKSTAEKLNKSCLILGAGLMQKPAILSARELGFKTYVVDANDKAVAISFADCFKQIDLKDKEGILEYAIQLKKEQNLQAVFTAGTDFSTSVSYVCQQLKLPSHSYEASVNASIKTTMRTCFKTAGVPSPEFLCIKKELILDDRVNSTLETINTKLSFPLVVKPVDNMGARGCRMVRTKGELLPSLNEAVECSRSGTVIVEEYMEGPEFSIDALIYEDNFIVTGFAERHIHYPPYFIEVGHTMPVILPKNIHDELISVFALGAKSLGLSCGAAKADIKYTKKGPMIGEIAGRLSGGYMSGWTYPYASGVNLTKQALLIASGQKPELLFEKKVDVEYTPSELCKNLQKPYMLSEVECTQFSAERAWLSIPGIVQNIEDIKDYTDKTICNILPYASVLPGSRVDFPRNNVQKCGNVISVSKNQKIAVQAAQDAVSNIFISLEPCNEQTEDFLNEVEKTFEKGFPPSAFGAFDDELNSEISGSLDKNQSVSEAFPQILKQEKYETLQDWSYNSLMTVAQKFDILRKNHPKLNLKTFWRYVFRGGLQAAVYYSDSLTKKGELND